MNWKHILTSFLVLTMTFAMAESTPDTSHIEHRSFDSETYQNIIDGKDFKEELKKEKQDPKDDITPRKTGSGFDWSVLGELFKVLAILFIVFVLGFLIFRLIDERYLSNNKKVISDDVLFERLEEHIHDVDLDKLLKDALNQQNYKMAVRVYYLILIKQLSDSEVINWKKDKTNGEYVSEMYGHKHFLAFQEATLLFERVWYGDIKVTQGIYHRIEPKFESLKRNIKPRIAATVE